MKEKNTNLVDASPITQADFYGTWIDSDKDMQIITADTFEIKLKDGSLHYKVSPLTWSKTLNTEESKTKYPEGFTICGKISEVIKGKSFRVGENRISTFFISTNKESLCDNDGYVCKRPKAQKTENPNRAKAIVKPSMPSIQPASQVLDEHNFNEILTFISQEEAEKNYKAPALMMAYNDDDEISPIGFYKGDLHVRSITAGEKTDDAKYKLIVDGSLIVDGAIDWYSSIGDSYLVVTGNVMAENIIISGNPSVYFGGNVVTSNSIMCFEGDDGGNLTIGGNVTAQFVLCSSYFTMSINGEIDAIKITDDEENFEPDYGEGDFTEIFRKGFADEETIDEHKVKKAVLAGKPVLKKI